MRQCTDIRRLQHLSISFGPLLRLSLNQILAPIVALVAKPTAKPMFEKKVTDSVSATTAKQRWLMYVP